MAIGGIGGRSAVQIKSLLDLRSRLDDLQRQLGTGQKANTYAGLGLDRGLAMGLRRQLATINSFDSTLATVGTRLSMAQTALTQIDSSVRAVKSSTNTTGFAINPAGTTVAQDAALGQLEQIVDGLNTRVGDQYIFSGKSSDTQPVVSTDKLLNGDATHAGLRQLIAERKQADLGAGGLGRLQIAISSGTSVTVTDTVSPFGFKLAGVSSSLTGASVAPVTGAPATTSIDLSAATLASGDTLKFTFNLPDGTAENLTLTATTANPPGLNQFTIGSTAALTAGNLQSALSSAVGTLAATALTPASAIAAANEFFNADAAHPPQRVAGPPFATATALVAGTSANTVTWYAGEAGSDPARTTAVARVDPSIGVAFGMRANEQALRSALANIAVFATTTFAPNDPNASGQYAALAQRVSSNLDTGQGVQKISDIEAEIANAQTTMKAAKDRHLQTAGALGDLLETVQGASTEEVASQILALQTRLQASLQTTAMLAHTSLVEYLS